MPLPASKLVAAALNATIGKPQRLEIRKICPRGLGTWPLGRRSAQQQRRRALRASHELGYGRRMAVSTSALVDSQLRAFADRYKAAWNGCDTTAMAELLTEDIVWEDPALPEPARGVPAVQEFMRISFRAFPDLRFGEPE